MPNASRSRGSSRVFAYIVRRLALMLVTLFGISVIIFVLLRVVPGNIVDILFDAAGFVDPADKANLEKELGLNEPIVVQYLNWISGLLQRRSRLFLRVGKARAAGDPAADPDHRAGSRGWRCCSRPRSAFRSASSAPCTRAPSSTTRCASSASAACRCPRSGSACLILMASVSLFGMMPIFNPNPKTWTEAFAIYAVPAMAVGFRSAALTMRITRSSMLEILRQDFIRTARAKGASERRSTITTR